MELYKYRDTQMHSPNDRFRLCLSDLRLQLRDVSRQMCNSELEFRISGIS